ncbi:hypothetical protein D3C76_1372040 [compost metagenome]
MNREPIYARHARVSSVAQPIITDASKHLEHVLRLFKREKYHLIYVMDKSGKVIAVIPEQRLISVYFSAERRLP